MDDLASRVDQFRSAMDQREWSSGGESNDDDLKKSS